MFPKSESLIEAARLLAELDTRVRRGERTGGVRPLLARVSLLLERMSRARDGR
jgi:hypothetical protein